MSKAKAFEGGLSARRQEQRKGRTHASPRPIVLSPDEHMARLQHYTSEQPQDACLVNDRYGGVRTACTRSEKQRCASAKAITAHHRQAGRELFLGRLERECIQSARGKVSRSCYTTPNQQAPGGMLASVSWHLVAVRADSAAGRGRTLGAEQVTAGVQSGIAHGARAGTSLLSAFPQEICRLAAGWLSEGARAPTTCAARRCSAPLFTCIARAVPLAPLSAAVVLSRAVEPCCLLLVSSPSLP